MSKPAKKAKRSREELLRIAKIDNNIIPMLPEPPEGYVYRWVRVVIQGKDDVQNISKYMRSGWEFVKPDEVAGSGLPIRDYGKLEGTVGISDLALAKLPAEVHEARLELGQNAAEDQLRSVNQQLGKLNDSRMPIHNESTSRAKRGKDARFD